MQLSRSLHPGPRRAVGGLAAVLVASLVMAGSAVAGHVASGVKSYTGCLVNQGGTLTLIREGNSPAKPCPNGSTQAHFSGGDITGVNVGTGLTGGGTNGDLTISLDPKYALRQDCTTGQVVKWDGNSWECAADADTTYTVGTGLALDGTQLSIDSEYRLPQDCDAGQSATMVFKEFSIVPVWGCETTTHADQDCASGKFANGIDEDGDLTCGTPSGGAAQTTGYVGKQTNPTQGDIRDDRVGVPDDGAMRTYARVTVSPGTYALTVTGRIDDEVDNCGIGSCFFEVVCRASGGGASEERKFGADAMDESGFEGNFVLLDEVSVASETTLVLACAASEGMDGVVLSDARIMAIRIG